MSVMETKNFGEISFEPDSELVFPGGLPGFENRRGFVAIHFEQSDPLVYLQSLEDPDLCFITMPVLSVDPRYHLTLSDADLNLLDLPVRWQPRMGEDVLCLTVLSLRETGPTANLLAPVVINLRNRKAVQAIMESEYSHQFELVPQETCACS